MAQSEVGMFVVGEHLFFAALMIVILVITVPPRWVNEERDRQDLQKKLLRAWSTHQFGKAEKSNTLKRSRSPSHEDEDEEEEDDGASPDVRRASISNRAPNTLTDFSNTKLFPPLQYGDSYFEDVPEYRR